VVEWKVAEPGNRAVMAGSATAGALYARAEDGGLEGLNGNALGYHPEGNDVGRKDGEEGFSVD
jgi:hypothetical protein